MAKARQFNEFIAAITARPPKGDVATVIGGQAVNYWCELAYKENPALAEYYPFTSADLDLVAQDKAQSIAIAKATGLKLVPAEQGYSGADRAALVDTRDGKSETVIQVLGGMYGVTDKELHRDTAEISIKDSQGIEHIAKIANHTALIKGKIALALAPDGMRSPPDKEHDRFHIRLLILCMAVATRKLVKADSVYSDRDIIKTLKSLLRVIGGKKAGQVAAIDPSIIWQRAIASEVLTVSKKSRPQLANYVEGYILPWAA